MSKINYLFNFFALAAFAGVVYLFMQNEQQKTAFFLSAKVYNEFDYKKELEMELSAVQKRGQYTLDSLENDLNQTMTILKSTTPTETDLIAFERKQQQYIAFRDQLESEYQAQSQTYYDQIWTRINEDVQAYGKEHGYSYIFGANGNGVIMYAEESEDITEEIITMINTTYAGE